MSGTGHAERRRVVVIRHAKSSWDDPSLADHDRPLSKRGRTRCPGSTSTSSSSGCAPTSSCTRAAPNKRDTRRYPRCARSTGAHQFGPDVVRRGRRATAQHLATPRRSRHDGGADWPQPRRRRSRRLARRRSGNRPICNRRLPNCRGRGPGGRRTLDRHTTIVRHARELLDATNTVIDAVRKLSGASALRGDVSSPQFRSLSLHDEHPEQRARPTARWRASVEVVRCMRHRGRADRWTRRLWWHFRRLRR